MKEQILSFLPEGHPWRERIHWFSCVDSTNDLAKAMAAEGAPEGTVLIADTQTGGRGRMGRSFCSPEGAGIYMSVILRPSVPAHELMHLTCAAAVAVCDAVRQASGLQPEIKWINDIIHSGKKLGGILTELVFSPEDNSHYAAIIGIGLNCNQKPEEFDESIRSIATSLSAAANKDVSRAQVTAAVILALEKMDAALLSHKADIMKKYRQLCITVGKDICVHRENSVRHGRAMDIDENGALVVSYPDGQTEAVQSGEVSVRGLYGYV